VCVCVCVCVCVLICVKKGFTLFLLSFGPSSVPLILYQVVVLQLYENPNDVTLEAKYVFPLDEAAGKSPHTLSLVPSF
jgi:hypothetical protein